MQKNLLILYPKLDKNNFSNIGSDDESWIHFFEPQKKVRFKIWATKFTKKSLYCQTDNEGYNVIFYTIYGPAIQVAVPKGKGVYALNYMDKVLKNMSNFFMIILLYTRPPL